MHHHDHDHHSHIDPAFELAESDCHQCGEHSAPHFSIECGHEHRIFGVNITYKPGDFIYWDSVLGLYVPAVEDKCDLMVLRVDRYGTWFEAANIGEFQLKNFTLKGSVYIDYVGELTNTETKTKIGFIENGHLYLSITKSTSDQSNKYIQNQKTNAQSANAWIDGILLLGTSIVVEADYPEQLSGLLIASSYTNANNTYQSAIFGDRHTLTNVNRALISGQQISLEGVYSGAVIASDRVNATNVYNSLLAGVSRLTSTGAIYSSIITGYDIVFTNINVSNSILNITSHNEFTYDISRSFVMGSSITANSRIEDSFIFGGNLTIGNSNYVFMFGSSHHIGDSCYYSAVFGVNNRILNGSYYSLVSGYDNEISNYAYYSAILGGGDSIITNNAYYSGILGGIQHIISGYSYYSAILGGVNNKILSGSYESGILAGMSNELANNSYYSAIVGGFANSINNGTYSVIFGGTNNGISENSMYCNIMGSVWGYIKSSYNSYINGGTSNTITSSNSSSINSSTSSKITSANYSAILCGIYNEISSGAYNSLVAGEHNIAGYRNQLILGKYNNNMSDSIIEIGNGIDNDNRSNIFRITDKGISEQIGLILTPQADNPATIVDGQLFIKSDGLYVQISGILYKVNLTVA